MKKKIIIGLVMLLMLPLVMGALNDADFYYSFDDADISGNALSDDSGHGRGALFFGVTTGLDGVIGQSFNFTDSPGQTVNSSYYSQSATGTLCIWINPDNVASAADSILQLRYGGGGVEDLIYMYVASGELTIQSRLGSIKQWEFNTNSLSLSNGVWTYLCLRQNGIRPEIYVDGSNVTDITFTTSTDLTFWTDGLGGVLNNNSVGVLSATSNLYRGRVDEYVGYSNAKTPAEIAQLYNSGAGFNPYNVTPMELTLTDFYDSRAIRNYSATFTNTSGSSTISTTNGTIYYPQNQIVNISVHSISDNNVTITHFNQARTDYDTSSNLQMQSWESVLIVSSKERLSDEPITTFNATAVQVGSQFNTSNSSGNATFYLRAYSYNVTGRAENHSNNATNTTSTLTNLGTMYLDLLFWPNTLTATAKSNRTQATINSFSVFVHSISFSNSTTGGSLTFLCPDTSCEVLFNASGFIYKNYTINAQSSSLQVNLSNATNQVWFFDASDNSALSGANITISSPSGREINTLTDSNGLMTFTSLDSSGLFDQGNYSITLNGTQGYETPITFYSILNDTTAPLNATFNISQTNINVAIYDRETYEILNTTQVTIIFQEVSNGTTSNGTFSVADQTIAPGTYVVQALADGYGTEQKLITYTAQSDLNIDFYLLNLTGDNTANLFTISSFLFVAQPDTLNKLYEYDINEKAYIVTSECNSNANGECQFFIELNVKTYYVIGTKTIGGTDYSDTTPAEILKADGEIRSIILASSNTNNLQSYDGVNVRAIDTYNSTWNTLNLSQIFVSFSVADGTSRKVCVEYFKEGVSENLTCGTSSGGLISSDLIQLDRSKKYTAEVYLYTADEDDTYTLFEFTYPSSLSLGSIFETENTAPAWIILIWILILSLGFMMKNISTLVGIGGAIWSVVEVAIFPGILMFSGMVVKMVLCWLIVVVGRRRIDTA